MKLDDLTIGDAKRLAAMFGSVAAPPPDEDYGWNVVVLDRGFVYVGEVLRKGDMYVMPSGRNIRYWGTDKGLHQLVTSGPTEKSKVDAPAFVRIPARAVISLHETDGALWKNS
jgi:hypothetical protein